MAYYASQHYLMEAVEGKMLLLINKLGQNLLGGYDAKRSTREIRLTLGLKRINTDKAAKWLLK